MTKMECEDAWMKMDLTYLLHLVLLGEEEGDREKGWANLRELESTGVLESSKFHDARLIMQTILSDRVVNLHEVPKLLAFFSKYYYSAIFCQDDDREDGHSIVSGYVDFVQMVAGKDIKVMAEMVEVLTKYPTYAGSSKGLKEACRAIIRSLGKFPMPGQVEEIKLYRKSMAKIKECLGIICKNVTYPGTDMPTVFLETVYEIISDTTSSTTLPGTPLIAVLELFEAQYIRIAVKSIIGQSKNDEELERALNVLCRWAPQCIGSEILSQWILEVMRGLQTAEKYEILNRVATGCLGKFIYSVKLPIASLPMTLLVKEILCRQSKPSLFHKYMSCLEQEMVMLSKNPVDPETSPQCVQILVNVSKALMFRFPGHPQYENFEKSFPVQHDKIEVFKLCILDVWSKDDRKLAFTELPVANSIDSDQLSLQQNLQAKVGLTNLGNTCYMNSVLQALAMTRQFNLEVMRYVPITAGEEDDKNLTIAASAEQAAQIMPKLQNLFALLSYSRRRVLAPVEILAASRPEYFTPKQQQDSSEFLCHLLDVLYEQEKTLLRRSTMSDDSGGTRGKCKRSNDAPTSDRGVIKRWTTEEDLSEGISLERKTSQSLGDFSQAAGEEEEKEQTSRVQTGETLSDCHSDSTDSGIQSVDGGNGSGGNGGHAGIEETAVSSPSILVHRVFGGESEITYQCAQCDTSSHNKDRFRDLQLCFPEEIADNQEVSVQDLMNYYLAPEKLTGENKYRCDRCTKLCDAQRIIKVLCAPMNLILTLKHFHYDPETRLRTKLRHRVRYNETIQLPVSQCDPVESSPIAKSYRLYAAVVHSGYSMDYGHYVTYARDSEEKWYKFNDDFVSRTSLEDFNALEPPVTPYILFYERIADSTGTSGDSPGLSEAEKEPELSSLSRHIQDLIEKDTLAFENEIRQQNEKKRSQRASPSGRVVTTSIRRHDNSDDENPPPSSCRGPVDLPNNTFLY